MLLPHSAHSPHSLLCLRKTPKEAKSNKKVKPKMNAQVFCSEFRFPQQLGLDRVAQRKSKGILPAELRLLLTCPMWLLSKPPEAGRKIQDRKGKKVKSLEHIAPW